MKLGTVFVTRTDSPSFLEIDRINSCLAYVNNTFIPYEILLRLTPTRTLRRRIADTSNDVFFS